MKKNKKKWIPFYREVFQNSVKRFIEQDTLSQAAAISYYMVFSLPPMLIVIFWVAGLWYEESLVRESVFEEIGELIGVRGATQLMHTLERLSATKPTVWAAILGIGVLGFTASTVLVEVKQALNRIFEVTIKRTVKQGILWLLLDRFISIAMLCVVAIILTISMIVSTLITAFGEKIEKWLGELNIWLILFDHFVLEFITLVLLFAITYRYVPDMRLKWKDTWFGAIITAVLFIVGKSLIEIIIGNSEVANYYDAAGSLLVLMMWVYYSSAIFLFGAILTNFRAKMRKRN